MYLDLFCLSATATVVSCNLYSNVISQRDETPPIDHIYIKNMRFSLYHDATRRPLSIQITLKRRMNFELFYCFFSFCKYWMAFVMFSFWRESFSFFSRKISTMRSSTNFICCKMGTLFDSSSSWASSSTLKQLKMNKIIYPVFLQVIKHKSFIFLSYRKSRPSLASSLS